MNAAHPPLREVVFNLLQDIDREEITRCAQKLWETRDFHNQLDFEVALLACDEIKSLHQRGSLKTGVVPSTVVSEAPSVCTGPTPIDDGNDELLQKASSSSIQIGKRVLLSKWAHVYWNFHSIPIPDAYQAQSFVNAIKFFFVAKGFALSPANVCVHAFVCLRKDERGSLFSPVDGSLLDSVRYVLCGDNESLSTMQSVICEDLLMGLNPAEHCFVVWSSETDVLPLLEHIRGSGYRALVVHSTEGLRNVSAFTRVADHAFHLREVIKYSR